VESAARLVKCAPREDIGDTTLARVDLSTGRGDLAVARFTSGTSSNAATEIRRLLLLARAENQLGHVKEARATTRAALDAGRPEGYIRPFLEEARHILPMLRTIAPPGAADRHLEDLVSLAETAAPLPSTSAFWPEPLTAREREVLQHLPTHMQSPQIAALMFISANTVKSHVKAIYRKLGAASRDEAVTIARNHGLL
jgi:LuxR family maltose regulon positive regulatory protein